MECNENTSVTQWAFWTHRSIFVCDKQWLVTFCLLFITFLWTLIMRISTVIVHIVKEWNALPKCVLPDRYKIGVEAEGKLVSSKQACSFADHIERLPSSNQQSRSAI